jgi:uncharacterized protein
MNMNILVFTIVLILLILTIDVYVFQAIRSVFGKRRTAIRQGAFAAHWGIAFLSILGTLLYRHLPAGTFPSSYRTVFLVGVFVVYFSKFFGLIPLLLDDLIRGIKWIWLVISPAAKKEPSAGSGMSRSEFLTKASLVSISIPFITMSHGIAVGSHSYRLHRVRVPISRLPSAFEGLLIAQISDIHAGSFFSRKAVEPGIELLMEQKPDLVFFTGDLVNVDSGEMKDYAGLFSRIKAPLGVYSVLGNHDYGDYRDWPSPEAKRENLLALHEVHRAMNWNLLLNEHRTLQIGNEWLSIIGVENWGAGRFSKYGDLRKAAAGTEEAGLKLLLSHDPSHWDAQIRPDFGDIQLTLSGHTHGFQFGVEIGDFKWSPSQYIYRQWAGLYREGEQHLYVNRGFGYIGYPGRVGIYPEITLLELTKA